MSPLRRFSRAARYVHMNIVDSFGRTACVREGILAVLSKGLSEVIVVRAWLTAVNNKGGSCQRDRF